MNARRWSARRVAALARAEALLLRRNPMALLTAFTPVAMVLFLRLSVPADSAVVSGGGVATVASLVGFSLLFVVYYNLVTALVARREERVLKQLRTGELRDGEILAGTAAPAVAIAWAQIAVGTAGANLLLDVPTPTNPVLVVAAITLGTAVCVLLATVTTALTGTVEMAQLTAAPVLIAFLLGLMLPVHQLPGPLAVVAQLLPPVPVADLVRLGLAGTTPGGTTVGLAGSFRPAAVPLLVLAAWLVAGGWATRRWFRWEPRR